jgi:hypothetical protein
MRKLLFSVSTGAVVAAAALGHVASAPAASYDSPPVAAHGGSPAGPSERSYDGSGGGSHDGSGAGSGGGSQGGANGASCRVTHAEPQPFTAWGDGGDYVLATGGSFEDPSVPWSLTGGAAVVTDNEPYAAGANALSLPAGASATSPCTSAPHVRAIVRFFVRSISPGAALHVQAIVTSGPDNVVDLGTIVPASSGWAVTAILDSPWRVHSEGKVAIQVQITSVGSGTAEVDDLYIDPFRNW